MGQCVVKKCLFLTNTWQGGAIHQRAAPTLSVAQLWSPPVGGIGKHDMLVTVLLTKKVDQSSRGT
ncbi:MAG TPA: hypothetical protein DEF45_01860 [Rhodopirellula sp.]|nr:hypothetical protein [Rhodopirellula sp.]